MAEMNEAFAALKDAAARVLQSAADGAPARDAARAGSLATISLKRLNRELFEDVEAKRQRAADAKQLMEKTNLQLENLLYEKNHYEKEIHSCRSFASAVREDLVWSASRSADDFLARAGPEFQCDRADAHQLMVKRLLFELDARKKLEGRRQELQGEKEALQKTITDRHKFLSWLSAELKKMRNGSKLLREKLGLPNPDDQQAQLALALPAPLRALFAVLKECKDHPSNPRVDVTITGPPGAIDEILAEQRKASSAEASADAGAAAAAAAGAEEEGEEEQGADADRRATSRGRLSRATGPAFPLVVSLHLLHEQGDEVLLSVAFRMLTTGEPSIAVRCDDDAGQRVLRAAFPQEEEGADAGATAAAAAELEPGEAPPPAASAGGEGAAAQLGAPLRWAQALAGLEPAAEGSTPLQAALAAVAALRAKLEEGADAAAAGANP